MRLAEHRSLSLAQHAELPLYARNAKSGTMFLRAIHYQERRISRARFYITGFERDRELTQLHAAKPHWRTGEGGGKKER